MDMKSILRKISEINTGPWIYIYCYIYIIYTLMTRITPFFKILEGSLNSIIFALLAIFGAFFIVIDFMSQKYMFKPRYTILLILFLICMLISTFLNLDYGLINNLKTMVWTSIHFLLLYPLFLRGTSKKRHRFMRILITTVVIIFSLAVLFSIWQYFFQIGYNVYIENEFVRQGFVDQRLFGVFRDPNYAGATALVVMICCFYLFFSSKKINFKIIWIIAVFLQLVYIVLCGSRSVFLGYLVTMTILLFLIVRRYALIHQDKADRTISSIFSIIIALMISLCLYSGVKSVSRVIPVMLGTADEVTNLDREDVNEDNISNNRFDIWGCYIESTLKSDRLLFGLSMRNSKEYISDIYPDSYVAKTGYETHNAYVSVFSSTGVAGIIVMLVFIFHSIRNVFNHIFIIKDYNIWFTLCLSIVGGLACYAFFISDLFFVNNMTTIVFWVLLGYVNSYKSRWQIGGK